jgi:hypothetical protein
VKLPLAIVASALAAWLVFGGSTWRMAAPAKPENVLLLYVGADDCAPCRVWQGGDEQKFIASPTFSRLTYRTVKAPTLFGLLDDAVWPDDLKPYRDRLDRRAGAPLWLIVADHDVVAQQFGLSQWRQAVLPKLESLVR